MNTAVSTDVKSLNDVVRDKVKETFVNMIPDDQWNALVKKCSDEFMEKELPNLIKDELRAKMRASVAEELAKATVPQWNNGRQQPSELVRIITQTLVPEIVTTLFSGIVQSAVDQTAMNMRNNTNRY